MSTSKTTVGRAARKTPRAPSPSEAALARADQAQRRVLLTRDVFLKSQGPPVVPIHLPGLDAVVLMRRVSLLDMARRGADYHPFRGAILDMIRQGGLKDERLEGEGLIETLDLAAKLALDTVVVTPAEIAEDLAEAMAADEEEHRPLLDAWQAEMDAARKTGDFVRMSALALARPAVPMTHQLPILAGVDRASLRPLFALAGEEPEPDQIVLRYALPDDDGRLPEVDGEGEIPPTDLVVILRSAQKFGPGALGRQFRGN